MIDYKNAILFFFGKYPPGMRINRPALVSMMVDAIHPMGTLLTKEALQEARDGVESFLQDDRALGDQSMLVWYKGKSGGISLRPPKNGEIAYAINPIKADVAPEEIRHDERPCHNCQRNNDVGSAKCWWCEASNPTSS